VVCRPHYAYTEGDHPINNPVKPGLVDVKAMAVAETLDGWQTTKNDRLPLVWNLSNVEIPRPIVNAG
jgi:hypothetical protein